MKIVIANKWNFETHKYEIVDTYETPLICDNLSQIVNCVNCGKELPFGETYTSLQYHNGLGFGYPVCSECYDKEEKERWKAKERNDDNAD